MKIEIESLEQTITIKGKDYLLVEKPLIERLLTDNETQKIKLTEYEKDIATLKEVVIGIIKVLGLYDETVKGIKPEIASGEESYIKPIVKSISSLLKNLMFNPKQIEKDFYFIPLIFPIIKKHGS